MFKGSVPSGLKILGVQGKNPVCIFLKQVNF